MLSIYTLIWMYSNCNSEFFFFKILKDTQNSCMFRGALDIGWNRDLNNQAIITSRLLSECCSSLLWVSVPCKWSRASVVHFTSGYEGKFLISILKNTRCCDATNKEITRSKFVILDEEFELVRVHPMRNSDSSTLYLPTLFLKTIKIHRIKAARAVSYFLSCSFWKC